MKVLIGFVAALASVIGIVSAAPAEAIADPNVEAPENHSPSHLPTKTASPISSSTTTTFIISITTLPGQPTPTTAIPVACPTVTHTTRPSNCEPMQCPVPGCTFQKELLVPCGCAGVKTALFVDGCQTACPEGCMTRLRTVTALCATPTARP
ncbi:uncharacterized protein F4812DRAFT_454153 [Daldinia caldariorum]|uniref:uncharacterized protein n=1 Tax=Daldinia caldariorum TaxID=326644 RepID=UPI002007FB63|nr:uncharacterized protein F4812DRAFT_454153 [Daldinia caldariorum]KAI1472336.1 hypothetical protein F4812DRAFT_454153 [Daldinia caldariorum]